MDDAEQKHRNLMKQEQKERIHRPRLTREENIEIEPRTTLAVLNEYFEVLDYNGGGAVGMEIDGILDQGMLPMHRSDARIVNDPLTDDKTFLHPTYDAFFSTTQPLYVSHIRIASALQLQDPVRSGLIWMYPKTDSEGEVLDIKAVLQESRKYDACRSLEDVLDVDSKAVASTITPRPIHPHALFFCTDPSTLHTTIRTDKHFDWYEGWAVPSDTEGSLVKPVELERIEKLLEADGGEMQMWPEHEHEAFLQVLSSFGLQGKRDSVDCQVITRAMLRVAEKVPMLRAISDHINASEEERHLRETLAKQFHSSISEEADLLVLQRQPYSSVALKMAVNHYYQYRRRLNWKHKQQQLETAWHRRIAIYRQQAPEHHARQVKQIAITATKPKIEASESHPWGDERLAQQARASAAGTVEEKSYVPTPDQRVYGYCGRNTEVAYMHIKFLDTHGPGRVLELSEMRIVGELSSLSSVKGEQRTIDDKEQTRLNAVAAAEAAEIERLIALDKARQEAERKAEEDAARAAARKRALKRMELAGASVDELKAYKAKNGGGDDDDGGDGDEDSFKLPEGFALGAGEKDEGAAVGTSVPVPGAGEGKGEGKDEGTAGSAVKQSEEETVFPHEIDKPEHLRRPFPALCYPAIVPSKDDFKALPGKLNPFRPSYCEEYLSRGIPCVFLITTDADAVLKRSAERVVTEVASLLATGEFDIIGGGESRMNEDILIIMGRVLKPKSKSEAEKDKIEEEETKEEEPAETMDDLAAALVGDMQSVDAKVKSKQERKARQRKEFLENHPSEDDSDDGNASDDSLFEYGSGKLLRREPVCHASELRFFLLSEEEHKPFARQLQDSFGVYAVPCISIVFGSEKFILNPSIKLSQENAIMFTAGMAMGFVWPHSNGEPKLLKDLNPVETDKDPGEPIPGAACVDLVSADFMETVLDPMHDVLVFFHHPTAGPELSQHMQTMATQVAELLVPLPNTVVCSFNMAENDIPFDELDPRAGGSVGLTILEEEEKRLQNKQDVAKLRDEFNRMAGRTDSPTTQKPANMSDADDTPKTVPGADAVDGSALVNECPLRGVVQGRSGVLFFTRECKTTPPVLRRPASVPGVLRFIGDHATGEFLSEYYINIFNKTVRERDALLNHASRTLKELYEDRKYIKELLAQQKNRAVTSVLSLWSGAKKNKRAGSGDGRLTSQRVTELTRLLDVIAESTIPAMQELEIYVAACAERRRLCRKGHGILTAAEKRLNSDALIAEEVKQLQTTEEEGDVAPNELAKLRQRLLQKQSAQAAENAWSIYTSYFFRVPERVLTILRSQTRELTALHEEAQHLRLREVFQLRRGREWHRTVRLAGDQPVVCFFYNNWCSVCRHLLPIYAELSVQFSPEVKFVQLDTSTNITGARYSLKEPVKSLKGLGKRAGMPRSLLDADLEGVGVLRDEGLMMVPAFALYHRQHHVDSFTGPDVPRLRTQLQRLQAFFRNISATKIVKQLLYEEILPAAEAELGARLLTEYMSLVATAER